MLVDDDVLGFDVTVDDALAVDEAQAFEEMGGEVFWVGGVVLIWGSVRVRPAYMWVLRLLPSTYYMTK